MTSGDLQEADKIRLRREAKKNRGFYVEDEAQLVFVIRIRGINDMAPKVSDVASVVSANRDVCRVAGTRKVHVMSNCKLFVLSVAVSQDFTAAAPAPDPQWRVCEGVQRALLLGCSSCVTC